MVEIGGTVAIVPVERPQDDGVVMSQRTMEGVVLANVLVPLVRVDQGRVGREDDRRTVGKMEFVNGGVGYVEALHSRKEAGVLAQQRLHGLPSVGVPQD